MSHKPLSAAEVHKVAKLFEEGATLPEVQQLCGHSPDTLRRIRHGKHKHQQAKREIDVCPGCNRKVKLPCVACEAEARLERTLLFRRNMAT